jgi:amidase
MEHRFQPTSYHNSFGSHPPVAHVGDGDRIITTTLDCRGHDAGDRPATDVRPNPLTGPFYVEGAAPGDMLAVELERIAPSRDTAIAKTMVADHLLEPETLRNLPPAEQIVWQLDLPRGVAKPQDPPRGLEGLSVPLEPMLGCLGVAPAGGQAISSATSGPHGGNMDWRGTVAGTTLYFPVSQEGALLFLGDGHAAQGDGEIVGQGLETSMEVTLRVRIVRGWQAQWPRAETATHLMTLGNARPMEEALQHATSEMLRWLEAAYGLDATAASTLLGQCVRYEAGNVYDPAFTMVCRLAKRWLGPRH